MCLLFCYFFFCFLFFLLFSVFFVALSLPIYILSRCRRIWDLHLHINFFSIKNFFLYAGRVLCPDIYVSILSLVSLSSFVDDICVHLCFDVRYKLARKTAIKRVYVLLKSNSLKVERNRYYNRWKKRATKSHNHIFAYIDMFKDEQLLAADERQRHEAGASPPKR